MTGARHGQLLELHVADSPAAWSAAGFAVDDSTVWLDGVALRLVGHHPNGEPENERGIRAWTLHGVDIAVDGLDVTPAAAGSEGRPASIDHPNGVGSIDHLVVQTDDFSRTLPSFDAAGLELRRTRRFELDSTAHQQCFFWLGTTILELVGPQFAPESPSPRARFWGLAFSCPDLDTTAEYLGELTTPVKSAVQRGRSISTLKTRDLDISVPVALMSPHVPSSGETD